MQSLAHQAPAGATFHFTSGSADILPPATGDRRLYVVPKPKKPRKPARVVYGMPDLPATGDRLFWLRCYQRNLAKLQACEHMQSEHYSKRSRGADYHIQSLVLGSAEGQFRDSVNKAAQYMLRDGLILMAVPA